jgi:hypothetical protein
MVDGRKKLHQDVMGSLRGRAAVLHATIPASAEIERMGVKRDAVAAFAPRGRAAAAYEQLWSDVRARLGQRATTTA